jgi:HK97 gp10 family phage protein
VTSRLSSVRLSVDYAALSAYAMPMLVRIANRVSNNSAARVPVDTGYLRSSRFITEDAGRTAVRVAYRAHYARWVHDGARGRPGRPFLTDAMNEEVQRL